MKTNTRNVKRDYLDIKTCKFFNKSFVLLNVFALLTGALLAQDEASLVDVIPPSPTAFEMTRVEAQQPALYTGTANVSIPLHTIDFDGWSLPLSLSYHASGIKPNQEATEVGLGWALNATAVISRTIRGTNDLSASNIAHGPGFPYDVVNQIPTDDFIQAESDLWWALKSGVVDSEPDQFSYTFFGYSGSFVFKKKKAADDSLQIMQLNADGCKIKYKENDKTFEIITPEGFIGEFTVKERSTSTSSAANAQVYAWKNENNWSDPTGLRNKGNMDAITGWYLSKITSPRNNTIQFTYNSGIPGANNPENYVSITQPTWGEGEPIMGYMTITRHQYLTGIEINGNTRVEFEMELRADLEQNYLYKAGDYYPEIPNGLLRYKSMTITSLLPGSSFNKEILFEQSYFNGDKYYQSDNYVWLRSRLDKVRIDDQEYKFEYDYGTLGDGLPHKSTRELDHFGFYNGNGVSLSSRRTGPFHLGSSATNPWGMYYYQTSPSNIQYKKIGSLKKVIYPTGGSHKYFYEDHEYYAEGSIIANGAEAKNSSGDAGNVTGGGLRIQSIVSNDGQGKVKKTMYRYEKENSTQSSGMLMSPLIYYVFNFVINQPGLYSRSFHNAGSVIATSTAEGKQIGYSRVEMIKTSNLENSDPSIEFKTVYHFTNDNTQTSPDLTALWNGLETISREHSYRNGQILSKADLSSGNIKVSENINDTIEFNREEVIAAKAFNTNSGAFICRAYAIPRNVVKVKRSTTTLYSAEEEFSTEMEYEYNDIFQIKAQSVVQSSANDQSQQTHRSEYTRPSDFTNPTGVVQDLVDANIISPVIESRNYVDGVLLSASATKYNTDLLPEEVYTFNADLDTFTPTNGNTFTGGYEKTLTINQYDDQGNVLEYIGRDGIMNSFIWGYRQEYPVVHGKGVTHSDLSSAFTAAGSTTSMNHTALRDHSSSQNGQVTSYTYDPQVGIKTVTDVNANTSSYEYDPNRRLEKVRDLEGNLVQQMGYVFSSPSTRILEIVDNSIDFGTVAPGSSATAVITLKNTGNDVLTVTGVSGISGVFSCNTCYEFNYNKEGEIGPGELFEIEVSFSPTAATSYSQTINILTDKTGGSSTVILSGTGANPTRILVLNQDCYSFSSSFSTLYMRIDNTGNSPLTITHVESNDEHVDPQVSFTNDPVTGWPVMVPITVQPNSFTTIPVRLSYQLNNWDGQAEVRISSDKTNNEGTIDRIHFRTAGSINGCPN